MEADAAAPLSGDPESSETTAMQNLSAVMTFEVAKVDNDKFLVARIAGIEVAPQTKTLSEGYAAGLAFLSHVGSWLPDYSYQTADLAIKTFGVWQPFAGLDASSFRAQTGSHVDVNGVSFVIGAATKRDNDFGEFLFGAYVEGGVSNYEVFPDLGYANLPDVGGDGHIRSLGFGLMTSLKFHDNLRFELSTRIGVLENDFESRNYSSAAGVKAGYQINSPYYGGHFGVGYEARLNDVSSLDFSAKYYYSYLKGQTFDFGGGDLVSYESSSSHRVRGGLRYTRNFTDHFSAFVGSYYDYEFANHAKAKTVAYNLDIQAPNLSGGTAVFELGAISRSKSNERISIEFGLQGYAGVFRGISGGFRIGYQF